MIKIKVMKLNPSIALPVYVHKEDAGLDLRCALTEALTLYLGQTLAIPTGLAVALPAAPAGAPWVWQLEIRSRSGLALNHGVVVHNAPGTVDAFYRGEIKVILHNSSDIPYTILPADRIAQAVLTKAYQIDWDEVEILDMTERGEGGFGSTGTK